MDKVHIQDVPKYQEKGAEPEMTIPTPLFNADLSKFFSM
jgi:hypothetical protein